MIRNAATLGGTPVPSRWRAARTGGRAGGAGWSTMGKAACRRVIPEFIIGTIVPAGVRRRGRAATLVFVPRLAILASRVVLRRRGGREAAGLVIRPVPSVRRRATLPGRRAGVGAGRVLGNTAALVVIPKFVGLAHRAASHDRRRD